MSASGIPNNDCVVIQGHMVEDMHLTGDELIAYAAVAGPCRACPGHGAGLGYIAPWLGLPERDAERVLSSLEAIGYVERSAPADGRAVYVLGANSPDRSPEGAPSVKPNNRENASHRAADDQIARSYESLKAIAPSTNGFSYGLGNYRRLIEAGYSHDEIADALAKTTAALRSDYPDRPARYMPHAERLLDPDRPDGVARFLRKAPDMRALLRFALTDAPDDVRRRAIGLTAAIERSASPEERESAVAARREWLHESKADLTALMTGKRDGRE